MKLDTMQDITHNQDTEKQGIIILTDKHYAQFVALTNTKYFQRRWHSHEGEPIHTKHVMSDEVIRITQTHIYAHMQHT